VFIIVSILIPVYSSNPTKVDIRITETSESVTQTDNLISAYPAPTEEIISTQIPYPYPRPTPTCTEYWFNGLFQGWVCVQP